MKTLTKLLSLAALGLGLMVAVPATAKADDSFRINVNLGGSGYYPAQVAYYEPRPVVVKHVYHAAPRRVVVREYNTVHYGYPVRRDHGWHRGHHQRSDWNRGYDRGHGRGHGRHR